METEANQRFESVRNAVLALHRALLAAERIAWEALNGRVPGNVEFLRLAIHDPWFLWLRPMTALIAAMDESLVDATPEGDARVPSLIAAARELLHPDDQGNDFQQRYFDLVQRFPEVAVAHGLFIRAVHAADR